VPFPTEGWPPPRSAGVRSIRVYVKGQVASGSAFADNNWLFQPLDAGYVDSGDSGLPAGDTTTLTTYGDYAKPGPPFGGRRGNAPQGRTPIGVLSDPAPPASIHSQNIRVTNLSTTAGEDLEFSFDGTNVHGYVPAGESRHYEHRYEAGIAIRPTAAANTDFVLEAW